MTDHLKHDPQGDQATHEVHERRRSVAVPALIAGGIAAVLGIAFLTTSREPVAAYVPVPPVYAQNDQGESQGTFTPRGAQADLADQEGDRTGVYLSDEIIAACKLNQPTAHFATNMTRLDESDRASLAGVIDCLKGGPLAGRSVEIIGHTDMRGSSDHNLTLGQQRADAVAGYLREQGVDQEQVHPTSLGKGNARATDPEGMAHERRVEIRLIPSGTTYP